MHRGTSLHNPQVSQEVSESDNDINICALFDGLDVASPTVISFDPQNVPGKQACIFAVNIQ